MPPPCLLEEQICYRPQTLLLGVTLLQSPPKKLMQLFLLSKPNLTGNIQERKSSRASYNQINRFNYRGSTYKRNVKHKSAYLKSMWIEVFQDLEPTQ